MLSSLNSGVSGLESFQNQMDVIGNNIANVNTTGFKAYTVNFQDAFSNLLQAPGVGSSTSSGADSVQVGTGVSIASTSNNWGNGAYSATGVSSNLAINGSGFFVVRNTTSGNQYAERAGDFSVDPSGYLIDPGGNRVQGYTSSGTTLGDVQITSGDPNNSVTAFSVDSTGTIHAVLQDNSTITSGQVLMQNFTDPQRLINIGNNLYTGFAAAGGLPGPAAAGTNGLGLIEGSTLELSNVDLANEMANLISAQRAFEANSKIITTSDETLDTVVNMKH